MKQIINVMMTKFKAIGFLRNNSGKDHNPFSLFLILTIAIPAISYSAPPAPPSGLCLSPGSICIASSTSTQTSVVAPETVNVNNFHPGHYLYAPGVSTAPFSLIADNPYFIGVKRLYNWIDLEPEENVYDFSQIESDLATLQAIGKRLFINLGYIEFNGKLTPKTPKYIWNDPKYGGGDCSVSGGSICSGPSPNGGFYGSYERYNAAGGWYPVYWNDNVQARFAALLKALGNRFNNEPYFEGLNLDETSTEKPQVDIGYSDSGLENGFRANAIAAKKAFPNKIVLQMINYAPFDIPTFAKFLADNGIAIGGPDVILHKEGGFLDTVTYPQYLEYHDVVATGPDVQGPDYEKVNRSTGQFFTAEDLLLGAIEKTNPWYIFWNKRPPYFEEDVIPTINKYGQLPNAKAFYDSL